HELRFLDEIGPFRRATGRRVLEVGCGAGFDAYEFCRHGADYTGIDLAPENIERARKHLACYGFTPNGLQADAEHHPFGDGSFDLFFSNGVLHHVPDFARALSEARRVLRPGGTCWVAVYHRDSLFFWLRLWAVDQILRGGWRERTLDERL